MNRIKFLIIGLLIVQIGNAQNPLLIQSTLTGTDINLTLQNGTTQFYPGQITNTMGVNGNILGPTLILNQGDFVNFSVTNQLAETTTVHWHGLHVSPENDGGPHTTIAANSTWSPSFTIMDKAATYWYHPHLHHFTDKHVSKGIAGMIIVKDTDEAALNLPRTYGIDDFPLIIQTKDFDANNQIVVHSNSDDVIMVNATIDPFLNVPSQVVRYRVLNGSSQRAFNLGLDNNQPFHQIASDGGLLSSPVQLTRLLLAPGERAEILIDFSGMNGETVYLKSYASELQNGIYGATNPGMGAGMTMNGYNPNPLNGSDFNIIQFTIITQSTNPITAIPSNLVTVTPIPAGNSNITRTLTFTPVTMGSNQLNGDFLINGSTMDLDVINYSVPLNNTEIWELTNQSAISHPFHIHDVQFNILTRNGVAPPVNEQGRKDVVLVKPQETVRFIAKFEDFTSDTVPYMYHCHLLTHEDGGMMGQFIVTNVLSVNENFIDDKFRIYPNPSKGLINIEFNIDSEVDDIFIYDNLGRIIYSTIIKNENSISVKGLRNGVFYIKLIIGKDTVIKKVIAY
ncbi:MAG: multicopper oxidase domain-containing protein [Flavobacteriaceae bacterium]|nr:T9SS type A sorting domain-containing protein [Flavobacteriaceae bacterium]